METQQTNNYTEIQILKASGIKEAFAVEKLKRSLHNAGASYKSIAHIVNDIKEWIYPGVTTKKIYSRAFSLLHKERSGSSIRYKLKQSIFELGPSGYPFEHFIGQIFERLGYSTVVGIVVDGISISHEMDVIATKAPLQHIMECKYHKDQGKQVSIQVPLYVRARVDDIIRKREKMTEYNGLDFKAWVVTNTRFSPDSIKYGECNGMKLLAWDYPVGNGLKDLIDKVKIYPITILSQLLKKQKQILLDKGIVSCLQLLDQIQLLDEMEISPRKQKALIKELHGICG